MGSPRLKGRGRIEAWPHDAALVRCRPGSPRLKGRGRIEAFGVFRGREHQFRRSPRLKGRGRIEANQAYFLDAVRALVLHGSRAVAALKPQSHVAVHLSSLKFSTAQGPWPH